jgi:hypothetical protein
VECKIGDDHKLYVPAYSTVPLAANQAELSAEATLADAITAFNALRAALVTAGLMAEGGT